MLKMNKIKRIEELERKLKPEPDFAVVIEPGDPIPEGTEVVIIDNI